MRKIVSDRSAAREGREGSHERHAALERDEDRVDHARLDEPRAQVKRVQRGGRDDPGDGVRRVVGDGGEEAGEAKEAAREWRERERQGSRWQCVGGRVTGERRTA